MELAELLVVEKILFSWSGGKDSAMALHAVQQDPALEVAGLLTSVVRASMGFGMNCSRSRQRSWGSRFPG